MTFIVPAALGGLLCFYCLRYANLEWRLFLIYCGGVFAACLHSPLTPPNKPAWDWLIVDNSARYWFFPMLAFVWSAVWCAVYGRGRLFKLPGPASCLLCRLASFATGITDRTRTITLHFQWCGCVKQNQESG